MAWRCRATVVQQVRELPLVRANVRVSRMRVWFRFKLRPVPSCARVSCVNESVWADNSCR